MAEDILKDAQIQRLKHELEGMRKASQGAQECDEALQTENISLK
jgi:hypothetical protein